MTDFTHRVFSGQVNTAAPPCLEGLDTEFFFSALRQHQRGVPMAKFSPGRIAVPESPTISRHRKTQTPPESPQDTVV